jgi:hypothetical protein
MPSAQVGHGAVQDALSAALVHPLAGTVQEKRSRCALPDAGRDRGFGRAGEHRHPGPASLAAEAQDREQSVVVQVLDVETGRFSDAQPVERQHTAQPIRMGTETLGGGEQIMHLPSAERAARRQPLNSRSAHTCHRRTGDELFLFAVAVEAGHRRELQRDRAQRGPVLLEFDVGTASPSGSRSCARHHSNQEQIIARYVRRVRGDE